jgi:hypothetical protein
MYLRHTGWPRKSDARDEGLARRDGCRNGSHPSRNGSHVRQEDGSQYEYLTKREAGLPINYGGTSGM